MKDVLPDTSFGEDARGMSCPCGKGRCGDGHKGCYDEAVYQQKRKP